MVNDFQPFKDVMTKIGPKTIDANGRPDTSYEIYLSLYQAIIGGEDRESIYDKFPRDFFDLIVVDDLAQAKIESGELMMPASRGLVLWEQMRELWQVVSGEVAGRNSDDDVTLFKSLGMGLWDIAAAKVVYDNANMMDPGEISAMHKRAEAEFGSVDIIVNNAGIQHVAPVDEFPEDKWNAIIAINMNSAFHLTKAALPGMKARGWGRVINIASAHALVASPFKSAYVAAKHGVLGLTKTVALEVAEHGITVNAICPGVVRTGIFENFMPASEVEGFLAGFEKTIPLGRVGEPGDIAQLALFLCSDAASWITGAVVPLDGGLSLGAVDD